MPHTPHPPATRAELLAATEAAGILTAGQLARARDAAPESASATEAAAVLVAAGLLTRFQADRLLAGRADGLVLGQHVIQEQVGKGSAGRVFKAVHRAMNRPVAIKVLRPELTRTGAARQALQREVKAAARLNHPNIVTAYDANEHGDRFYLVMEFVDGPTMEALVRERGPLPVAEACELVRQVAVGLQHAHERGMVHRDIKPANLLVGRASKTLPGCVVKIADFGIARLSPGPGTAAGLVGTPDYVAPEQAANPQAADHRADLYSLGCVFYFLLAGAVPFPGGTAAEKVRRHQSAAPVPVEQARPDVPPAVAEIVARLLAKNPNQRFQSAAGLAARLDGLAAGAVVDDTGGVVSFELPAVTAGYLSGAQATTPLGPVAETGAETSPWAELTDEIVDAGPTAEVALGDTPVIAPPAARASPRAAKRAVGVSPVALAALSGTAVVASVAAIGFLLRVLAK